MRSEFLSDSGLVLPSATQCLRMQCRLDCSLRTSQTGMGCTMCCLHPQHQSHMTHAKINQAEGGGRAPVAAATLPFSHSTHAPADDCPG